MLPTYELILLMLRFKLDNKSVSHEEIEVIKKYKIFANLFPIKDPSNDEYVKNFNSYIETVPYL